MYAEAVPKICTISSTNIWTRIPTPPPVPDQVNFKLIRKFEVIGKILNTGLEKKRKKKKKIVDA
jgi:hypothetical protein